MKINLNADMGESFGAYTLGDDAALLEIVATANIACGFHGGDPSVMRRTMAAAAAKGVSVGAHPSFDDLAGFGRRRIRMAPEALEDLVVYQIAAAEGVARAAGARLTHVKAHGALNNMASVERGYADAICRAVRAVDPTLLHLVSPGTALEAATLAHDLPIALEAFIDRAYEANGVLTPRSEPGALIVDPAAAAARALALARDGVVIARTGERLAMRVDSLCVHGDGPTAVAAARAARAAIEAAGIEIAALPQTVAAARAP